MLACGSGNGRGRFEVRGEHRRGSDKEEKEVNGEVKASDAGHLHWE